MALLLHDLFRGSVLATPDAAAATVVTAEGTVERLTYAKLDALCEAVAAALKPIILLSVMKHAPALPEPSHLIGLCCPPSAGLVAGLLGVLCSKCAYVPLPTARIETHRLLLSKVHLTVVLVHANLVHIFWVGGEANGDGWHLHPEAVGPPELKLRLLTKAPAAGLHQDCPHRPPQAKVAAACLLQTSGTTSGRGYVERALRLCANYCMCCSRTLLPRAPTCLLHVFLLSNVTSRAVRPHNVYITCLYMWGGVAVALLSCLEKVCNIGHVRNFKITR